MYRNMSYIADELFPMVPVQKQSDIVPMYDQSHWFRDDAALRSPGDKSVRGGWTVDTTHVYHCPNYAFGHEIPDELRANADSVWNLDREATEFVSDKLMLRRERAFASTYFTTGQWGSSDPTPAALWSDYAGSSPLVDVETYKDDVEALIGREPNTFAIGKQVWLQLKWHPDLIDTIKYTQRGQITEEIAASLFGVNKFLIGRNIYTTTNEGVAEASVTYTRVWGKNGLLLYVPDRPSLMTPSAGYTFVWQVVPAAMQFIRKFRVESRRVDVVEGNSYFTQMLTGKNAGVFINGAVA